MTTEQLLKLAGFKNLTGSLWQHPDYGMMNTEEILTATDFFSKLWEKGRESKSEEVRKVLGIKQPRT